MAVYIPTLHSKIRYYERVEEDYSRRDETIRLAKKYGLRLKDIPKQYHRERKFMCNNKIYYNDKIYIFTNSQCYKLITIYNNTSPILTELFNKKELNIKKSNNPPITRSGINAKGPKVISGYKRIRFLISESPSLSKTASAAF